jgi:hypothetical protein
MAPELFGEVAKYTEGSDVFGMGMIFVELCTNQVPWGEDLGDRPPIIVAIWLKGLDPPNLSHMAAQLAGRDSSRLLRFD